ncbi:MAG: hypothetical protein FWF33_05825 [Clostridiales bacterium]|nr:hypothetical protein [Clostridiales bacterium]
MIKHRLFVATAIILSLVFFMSSCSIEKNVPLSFYKDYKSEVLKDNNVKDVNLTFTRPALTIEVQVSNSISDDEVSKIFDSTKSFVTIDKMNAIAKYIKWNDAIWYVYLEIRDSDDGTLLKQYNTGYFKTNNASDYSPENIDGYKTWGKITIKE